MSYKERIAARAAQEIQTGQIVNFGIGIPTLIPQFLAKDKHILIHSENGILGMGPPAVRGAEDRNLIDAGGTYVTVIPGASFFDSSISFALVRGGRLDIAFLGALQVSESGDLANWLIPGKYAPGIGGGMELAQKAKRVIVTTTHTDQNGNPKILKKCTLPLTARGCVNLIITDLAVMEVSPGGLVLREIAIGTDRTAVLTKTEASLIIRKEDIPRF